MNNPLPELFHMYKLVDWLKYKDGTVIKGNELYRQNKSILQRLSSYLPGLPTNGTKEALINGLKTYVFTDEQKAELKEHYKNKEKLRSHEARRVRINMLKNGPRPYEYITQIAIDLFEQDDF
jgi:hypothetical protein